MGDIRDAEVACEHRNADREMPPGTGAGIGEQYLKESVPRVHGMLRDIEPCYIEDYIRSYCAERPPEPLTVQCGRERVRVRQ